MNEKFLGIYDCILEINDLDDKSKKYERTGCYEDAQHERICKFCVRTVPNVTFKKEAHAISESIGNKNLIAYNECDDCNAIFGETYEDSFGKYVLPFKIVSQIYGKSNKLKHKSNGHRIEIRQSSSVLPEFDNDIKAIIMDNSLDRMLEFGKNEDGFTLKIKRQKYNPFYVYKALLKMAFSIMPNIELKEFINSLVSLKIAVNKDTSEEEKIMILNSAPNIGFLEFVPGINPFEGVGVKLFKRKANDSFLDFSYFVFKLYFGNFSLQIPVPSDNDLDGKCKHFIPYVSFDNSYIQKLDFTTFDPDFYCKFSADKIEIDKKQISQLESLLRDKGWLNNI